MNKKLLRFASLPFLAIPFLASCGGGTPALPTSANEKVAFAFNGVEKSMKAQSSNKRSALNPLKANPPQSIIDELFGMMESEGQTENPEFPYDEPPMIQFQYINAIYKAVGNDFNLGTTYYDVITGEVDYDFSTGEKGLKQNYTMNLSLDISIDSNDLIYAHCGMDILYRDASNKEHNQLFYAELELDYDMQKTEPNYKLGMYYVDDCASFLGEEAMITYEYDYVNVIENRITEWRKATITPNKRVNFDANHADFAAYLKEEDFKYVLSAKGYRNSTLYKATRNNEYVPEHQEPRKKLGAMLTEKLGCNGRDIHYLDFFATQKTKNAKVTDVYKQFSKTLGMDICQSIVISGVQSFKKKTPEPEEDKVVESLAVYRGDTHEIFDLYDAPYEVVRNCNIYELFTDPSVYRDTRRGNPILGFGTASGEFIAEASLSDMNLIVASDGESQVMMEPSDTMSTLDGEFKSYESIVFAFDYIGLNDKHLNAAYVVNLSDLLGKTPEQSGKEPYDPKTSEPFVEPSEESSEEPAQNVFSIVATGDFCNWGLEDGAIEFMPREENNYEAEFNVIANQQFVFVINRDWNLPYYGYEQVTITESTGLFDAGDNGNIKAIQGCHVVAKATAIDSKNVQISISGTPDEDPTQVDYEHVNYISVVGDFNKWDPKSGDIVFDYVNEYTFKKVFTIDAGVQFKFVINKTWLLPSYGYNEISDFRGADKKDVFAEGTDNSNVKVLAPVLMTVVATHSSPYDISFSVSVKRL